MIIDFSFSLTIVTGFNYASRFYSFIYFLAEAANMSKPRGFCSDNVLGDSLTKAFLANSVYIIIIMIIIMIIIIIMVIIRIDNIKSNVQFGFF